MEHSLIETIKNLEQKTTDFETWITQYTSQSIDQCIKIPHFLNLKRLYEQETWVQLYPHQKQVFQTMKQWRKSCTNETKIRGGIISLEMGLGKTIMTLSFLQWNKGKMNLVVCDKSTTSTWIKQIQEHYSNTLNVFILHETYAKSADTITLQTLRQMKVDIVIVTFGYLAIKFSLTKKCLKLRKKNSRNMLDGIYSYNDLDTMGGTKKFVIEGSVKNYESVEPLSENPEDCQSIYDIEWDVIVMDETTKIMNMKSNASIASNALCSKFYLVLSGTPILNYSKDLCSVFQFIGCPFIRPKDWNKSIFEEMNLRNRMIELSIDEIDDTNTSFKKPPKALFETVMVDLDDDQKKIHYDICSMFNETVYKKNTLSLFMYALRICISKTLVTDELVNILVSHHKEQMEQEMMDYDSDDTDIGEDTQDNLQRNISYKNNLDTVRNCIWKSNCSPKYKKCLELCLKRKSGGVLIFSKYSEPLEQLNHILQQEGNLKTSIMNGKTASQQRTLMVDQANEKQIDVLLMTYNIGACSLNLSKLQTIILLDSAYNNATESQAVARCRRLGQKEIVHVYSIICRETFEEYLNRLKDAKEEDKNNFMNEEPSVCDSPKNDPLSQRRLFRDFVDYFLKNHKN